MKVSLTRCLAAVSIPICACLGTLWSYALLKPNLALAQLTTSQLGPNHAIQLLVLGIICLLCSAIAIWWAGALAWLFLILGVDILRGRKFTERRLPKWAPPLFRSLLGGLFTVSFFSAVPAHAIDMSSELSCAAINAPSGQEENNLKNILPPGLFASTGIERLDIPAAFASPLTPFPTGSTASLKPATVQNMTAYKQVGTTPLSPFFTSPVSNHANGAFSADSLPATIPPGQVSSYSKDDSPQLYTVKAGDTLWEIAESQLTVQASGQEILEFIHKIQKLNQQDIPTLDSLIFPGQQLKLPSNNS